MSLKLVLLPIALSALVLPALTVSISAQPAPAGKCSLDEGLVANLPNPGAAESHPRVLAMPLPHMGNAVADVAFLIQADGSVTDVKLLCLSVRNVDLEAALKDSSKSWKFALPKESGPAKAMDVTYRVSAAGVEPLSFAAGRMGKIQS